MKVLMSHTTPAHPSSSAGEAVCIDSLYCTQRCTLCTAPKAVHSALQTMLTFTARARGHAHVNLTASLTLVGHSPERREKGTLHTVGQKQ